MRFAHIMTPVRFAHIMMFAGVDVSRLGFRAVLAKAGMRAAPCRLPGGLNEVALEWQVCLSSL